MPLPSIMELFGRKPAVEVPPAGEVKTQEQNPTVPSDKTVKADGTGPAAIPKAGEGEKSPLENYAKLWETDPNAPKAASLVPDFQVDPAKLLKAAQTIDFGKVIPADVLDKAAKGDSAALSQAITSAAQAGYAQSAAATAAIVKQALTDQAKVFKDSVMPQILREHASSRSISTDNPLLDNPALKPMVDSARAAILAKNPTASPEEIAKQTSGLFTGMMQEMAKAAGLELVDPTKNDGSSGQQGMKGKETDWSKFFGESPAG